MKKLLLSLLALAALGVSTQAQVQAQPQPDRSRVVEATMKSDLLGREKPYLVYLPAGYDTNPDKKYPVLYLLHGASDTHTAWRDKGVMQLITDQHTEAGMTLPMIVVMPDARGEGENNTGKNMGYFNQEGWPYEDHFFTEFIPYIEKTYRIIGDKQHRAVAGLSMGGGGSAAYAQRHPEMFSSACPLSGALGGMSRDTSPERHRNSPVGFVENATPEQVEALKTVRWYVDCGDDDFLWQANVAFFGAMKAKGIPLQYRMRNGGHNWEYWQTALPEVLTFISIGFAR
uniref:Carbohydrate esterase family 1 protein n=1 Tax=termite gut metagenome TaxID=433724 RepID=S0DG91_9ZZZZ